ncbi:MAG TPA: PQQ-binding-like beta-propeller repeat protein, partial [Urbifossiella sp.]|nr:PQQ-binding-like beta-propeller repeat protein [Urbifossiella sp.]
MIRARSVVVWVLFSAGALAVVSPTRADDWPMWRGPAGQGHSAEKNLPVTWSATENVRWQIALPDAGNSTPVVWGDRIFLTQATEKGKTRALWCLDRKDGARLWEKAVHFDGKETIHATNTYCAGSPATDGTHVVVSYGSAGTYCYDFSGRELWKKDFGPCNHDWGNSSSPVTHKDLTFLNFGPHEKPFLVALKTADGTEVWKNDETGKKPSEFFGSWSTPVVATVSGRTELLMTWPGVVKSYEPETG